jgi:hypothetical protein
MLLHSALTSLPAVGAAQPRCITYCRDTVPALSTPPSPPVRYRRPQQYSQSHILSTRYMALYRIVHIHCPVCVQLGASDMHIMQRAFENWHMEGRTLVVGVDEITVTSVP